MDQIGSNGIESTWIKNDQIVSSRIKSDQICSSQIILVQIRSHWFLDIQLDENPKLDQIRINWSAEGLPPPSLPLCFGFYLQLLGNFAYAFICCGIYMLAFVYIIRSFAGTYKQTAFICKETNSIKFIWLMLSLPKSCKLVHLWGFSKF